MRWPGDERGMSSVSDLSHLRSLVALADEMHFGRAAARLNMSQPPLSRHVQLLEYRVGVRLVERSSRRVTFTAAGDAFVSEARRVLKQIDDASHVARQIAAGAEGVVRVGFTAASSYSVLPRLLSRARECLPRVVLELEEMVTVTQLEALTSGRIHVGLLRPPASSMLEVFTVAEEALVVALPVDDERVALASVNLPDLNGRAFVAYRAKEANYFSRLLDRLFEAEGVAPLIVQRVAQIHTMLALVGGGVGAALVPESARAIAFPGVAFRTLRTTPAKPVALVAGFSELAPLAARKLLGLLAR